MDNLATTSFNGQGYRVSCDAWDLATAGQDIGPVFKLVRGEWKRVRSATAIAAITKALKDSLKRHNRATRNWVGRIL